MDPVCLIFDLLYAVNILSKVNYIHYRNAIFTLFVYANLIFHVTDRHYLRCTKLIHITTDQQTY